MHENQKVSSAKEAPENVESNFYESEIYQIDNTSLEGTK